MIEYILIDHENGIDKNGNTVNLYGTIRLINGQKIQVFESIDDRDEYISNMPKPFDLDGYKQQVNDAHTALYISLWQARDYKYESEINLYADLIVDKNTTERQLEWKQEAISLRDYYLSTVDILYNYFDIVTEETAIPVEEFIQKLPIFNG